MAVGADWQDVSATCILSWPTMVCIIFDSVNLTAPAWSVWTCGMLSVCMRCSNSLCVTRPWLASIAIYYGQHSVNSVRSLAHSLRNVLNEFTFAYYCVLLFILLAWPFSFVLIILFLDSCICIFFCFHQCCSVTVNFRSAVPAIIVLYSCWLFRSKESNSPHFNNSLCCCAHEIQCLIASCSRCC